MPETTVDAAKAGGCTDAWIAEYEQINNNFRMLADIRFKLLALVPTLGGAAVYVLSEMMTRANYATVGLLSMLGFLATLGITFYDQRNSELYGLLIQRGGQLEDMLVPAMQNFRGRRARGRYLLGFVPMGHDTGLALIYAPVLAAWLFPLVGAILAWQGCSQIDAVRISLLSALIGAFIFFGEFLRLDKRK